MSLNRPASLETFSFVPGADGGAPGERRGSDAGVGHRARKLSFNPLPEAWDPPSLKHDTIQAVGAFEVPKWKRIGKFRTSFSCSFGKIAPGIRRKMWHVS
jgi:hypothetical protein